MNANTQSTTKEVKDLFDGSYCDVSISNNIMEETDIRFCIVGYDEENSLLIIDKDGVHLELNGDEIDNVKVDEGKDKTTVIISFSDCTTITVTAIDKFETRHRYANELMTLELIRDRYKREYTEDFNN